MTPRFVIASPAYNAAPYVAASLRSALDQVYDQFSILWLDDGSTDDSFAIASEIARTEPRLGVARNTQRYGATRNYHLLASMCPPDRIFVFLDADDQLAHPGVLRRLAGLYLNPNVWATYGQFRYDDISGGGIGMAAQIPADNHTRRAGWRSTHLKTCYAGLLHAISARDLCMPGTDTYFPASGDCALFYPVIEMASAAHARFVSEVLYIYGLQNPLNDVKVQPDEQREWAKYIETRPPYTPLERLPWRT